MMGYGVRDRMEAKVKRWEQERRVREVEKEREGKWAWGGRKDGGTERCK